MRDAHSMQKHRDSMLKPQRRPPGQLTNRYPQTCQRSQLLLRDDSRIIKCEKEEFVCQGWGTASSHDQDEDLIFCSSKRKCKYINSNILFLSPTLYPQKTEVKYKADCNLLSFHNVPEIPVLANSIKVAEDGSKTKSSQSSTVKYSTINKDVLSAIESGNKVNRLLCLTDNRTSRRYKLYRSPNASEEKVNISVDQCERQANVTKTQDPILCVIHGKKNSEDVRLKGSNDIIENYKDAIAILRGQTSCLNPSESLEKNSFHGHIQTCILQLSNRSPVQPTKLISCDDNSLLIKSTNGKVKEFERQFQKYKPGHHHDSFCTPMSKVYKANQEKFVWRQNTQEISRVGTCADKAGHVRILPVSSGKENVVAVQDVWGFPAFHPYPMKTQHGISCASRNQSRSGNRNQSAPRHTTSSQSHIRHIADTNKDLVSSGNQVTLGLILSTMRNGLKKNQVRIHGSIGQ